jgi:hypothetical protein
VKALSRVVLRVVEELVRVAASVYIVLRPRVI